MIVGFGIDLIDHSRVQRELARGAWLAQDGVFTPDELADCAAVRNRTARYAACFAAKEAALKALGLGVRDFASFREAELHLGPRNECKLLLTGRLKMELERLGAKRIILSISRSRYHTIATVILQD